MTEHMNEDVKRAIISRRSVRKFLSTEISKDIIKDILNVAARAPSAVSYTHLTLPTICSV